MTSVAPRQAVGGDTAFDADAKRPERPERTEWPDLPDAIRLAVLALISTARQPA
jgi:hypothetical protein